MRSLYQLVRCSTPCERLSVRVSRSRRHCAARRVRRRGSAAASAAGPVDESGGPPTASLGDRAAGCASGLSAVHRHSRDLRQVGGRRARGRGRDALPQSRTIFANARYMLNSTRHFKPLLNSYSGFVPASYYEHYTAVGSFPSESRSRRSNGSASRTSSSTWTHMMPKPLPAFRPRQGLPRSRRTCRSRSTGCGDGDEN